MLSGARTELSSLHYYNLHSWHRARDVSRVSPVSSDSSYGLISSQRSVWNVMGFGTNAPFYRTGPAEPPAADSANMYSEIRELETELSRLLQSVRSQVNTAVRRKAKTRIEEIRAAFNAIAERARQSSLSNDEIRMVEHRVRMAIGVLLSSGSAEMRILSGVKYYEPFRAPPSMADPSSDGTRELMGRRWSVWDVMGNGSLRPFLYSDGAGGAGQPPDEVQALRAMQADYFSSRVDALIKKLKTALMREVAVLSERDAQKTAQTGIEASLPPSLVDVNLVQNRISSLHERLSRISDEAQTFAAILGPERVEEIKRKVTAARTEGDPQAYGYQDVEEVTALRNLGVRFELKDRIDADELRMRFDRSGVRNDTIYREFRTGLRSVEPGMYGGLFAATLWQFGRAVRSKLTAEQIYDAYEKFLVRDREWVDRTVDMLRTGGGAHRSKAIHYYDFGSAPRSMADATSDGTLEAMRGMHSVWDVIGSGISAPFYRSGPSTVAGLVEETGETSGGAFEAGAGHYAGVFHARNPRQATRRAHTAGARTMVQTRARASLPVMGPAMTSIRSTIGKL